MVVWFTEPVLGAGRIMGGSIALVGEVGGT